jgi:hypothetical protein
MPVCAASLRNLLRKYKQKQTAEAQRMRSTDALSCEIGQ